MIEVKNLVKKYGQHTAVDDLSFTVNEGQVYGLLGPNGAGKTTTMNIMTGYIAATEGTVTIDGHDILDEPEAAKACIGYLPEQPPLYPEMTPLEYLEFACGLKKVPKQETRAQIEKVMKLSGITDVKDRLIKHLSKGYRQRLGLAQALLNDPKVIILDEPTVGLDPLQIIEIRDLIKQLGKNHTVILSSHILSEVSAICDRIMIISKGKLVACDTPENLSSHMLSSRTLSLTLSGTDAGIEAELAKLPGVRSIKFRSPAESNTLSLDIESDMDTDIREAVFYALCKANRPILEMTLNTLSLEDVFLELTAKDIQESDTEEAGASGKEE